MIITKNVDIDFTNDIAHIEKELLALGIEPLRWAIVDSDNKKLTISVSFESQ